MEHDDTDFDISLEGPPRKSPLRWVLRGTFAICATLMAMVILSEPSIRARISTGTDWVANMVAPRDDVAMMETELVPPPPVIPQAQEPEPRIVPQVRYMPTSRIPVRRGSVARED